MMQESPTNSPPEDTRPTSTNSDRTGSPGASTFGFETMLGKLVVDMGLVTEDELVKCKGLQQETQSAGGIHTLADILVNHEFATRSQIQRLQSEFDTRKSTQRIQGYKIIRKLGAGAMATVFLAQQESLDRPVAIKVLPKKFSESSDFIDRFYKEGKAAAKLNHPNIVQAYDVGQSGDYHYFVMEYVDGETVYDQIISDGKISEDEAIPIIKQVAKALQHAHERGFIHRDVKPKNIMITKQGTVKLADLGLARALHDVETAEAEAGRAYGTPYYISPEQIRGKKEITPSADLYGLGATLYHMVTGAVPFAGKNPSDVMRRHLKQPLEPPDHKSPGLSAGFSQVIEMMMAKDANLRYQNASDLLEDLETIEKGGSPQFAQPTLDFAMLAEVSGSSAPTPIPHSMQGPPPNKDLATLWMTLFIVSVIVNLVLLALWLASS